MKRLSVLFVLLLLTVGARAQQVVLSCDKLNVFYEDISNPVSYAVEKSNCESLIVTTDNGSIEKAGPCKFNIKDCKEGLSNIYVKKKQNGKVINVGEGVFRVKSLPLPVAAMGYKHGGNISIKMLADQVGVIAQLNDFDFETHFKISRFHILIVRNGVTILNEQTVGNKFSAATIKAFNAVKEKDLLIVDNIFATCYNKREKQLENMEFTIVP